MACKYINAWIRIAGINLPQLVTKQKSKGG